MTDSDVHVTLYEIQGAANQEGSLCNAAPMGVLSSHTQPYSTYRVHSLLTHKTNCHTHTHTEGRAADAHYSHSGDVLSRKGIRGVTDQQAGLPYSSAEDESDKCKGG